MPERTTTEQEQAPGAPPLVELWGVGVRLGGRAVLSGVSMALRPDESWALLGPNGSGKSTLLRVLRGDAWPDHEGGGRREFRLTGPPSESPIGVRERIGFVSPELQQEYARRDWALPVEAVVRSGFTDSVWPPEAATPAQAARIDEVLAWLGVGHLSRRSILELSSGEARKVMLARALASAPRLLFLDEPCHGLDARSRGEFLDLLSGIARRGTPLVLATHRLDELVPEITKVAVLHAGRILAQGERSTVLRRRGRATGFSTATSTSTSTATPAAAPSAHDARWRERPPASPPIEVGGWPPPTPPQDSTARTTEPRILVHIEDADVRVDGRPVLHGVSWTVRAGESWAVLGPNGAGKSTLLRLLVGDEQAMPGGRVARLDLGERADAWEVKARVGVVSPELQARHRTDLLAEDVVASGFTGSIGLADAPSPAQRAAAARCMERLGVGCLAGRRIHEVSYGEARRLLLARALVRDPELLVLDEPCDGLDPEARAALVEALDGLCRGGLQLVFVTHHGEDLPAAVDHVLELRGGRVAYAGPRASWRPAAAEPPAASRAP